MKKYRPYCAGYIVLYVLGVLCIGDAGYTLYSQLRGIQNSFTGSFALFSYLIAVLAVLYVKMYISSRVEIDDKVLRAVGPMYIKPAPDAKRAMFIYRQSDMDIVLSNKRILLSEVEKYGYGDDLKIAKLDQNPAGPNNKLFPLHEVVFVLRDGTKFHMNAASYSKKQRKAMFSQVAAITGVKPSGSLAKELNG